MTNKREIFGWAMFDFANSAYTTNVVTVIFCLYFTQGIVSDESSGKTYWGMANMVANLLIILTAPVIGAIADFSSSRKKFLVSTCLLCVVSTAGLFFATPGAVFLALFLYVISNYFFQMSESLCGSFLPDLAEPDMLGRISGLGWSLGYFGGLLSLVLCYPFIAGGFGDENEWNLRLTNLITAGVFLFGAIPTFLFLREHGAGRSLPEGQTYVGIGFSRVRETLTHLRQLYDLAVFLGVFFLVSVGLMTIFSFSSIYSVEEMKFSPANMMKMFIIVQLSAAAGAFVFGFIQDKFGLKRSFQVLLILWVVLLLAVYATYSVSLYWIEVMLLGSLLGSVQSAARGLVALFAPPSKNAEIFGFWSLTYKLGGLFGPLMYGLIADNYSHRLAMLTISLFFLFGFLLCFLVREDRGRLAGQTFENGLGKVAD